MNWLKLTARERELLVLKHVFKAKAWTEQRGEYTHVVFRLEGERDPWMSSRDWEVNKKRYAPIEFEDIDPHKHIAQKVASFPTDIAAAWLVVERMRENGFGSEVGYSFKYFTYQCSFESDSAGGYAEADTAPEAICLAALRAMGVEG